MGVRDRQLEVAYTVHRAGLCPHCGYPREVCGALERFEAQVRFCYAKAAVDQAQEDTKAPEPGQFWVPVYQPPVEI